MSLTAPNSPILCVGETLWDVLPAGEFLGGAPLNVAGHLSRLGTPSLLLSRVGCDTRGKRARDQMRTLGIDTRLVQIDSVLPTGEARAILDADGSASYEFLSPAAWDKITIDDSVMESARTAAAVVFGTLARRTLTGTHALTAILKVARWRILDVNLRAPHDDRAVVLESLRQADFVKLNDSEVQVLACLLGTSPYHESFKDCLTEEFGTSSLCITRGERGALLWHQGQWTEQPAFPTVVADTVGAGDSFLAMLLRELIRGSSAATAMQQAARLASYVASHSGAIPEYPLHRFMGET